MTVIATSFTTGRTLTLTARQPDGTLRGTASQEMSEDETEHYVVDTDVDLEDGDIVKISDSVWGPVMTGEYTVESTEVQEQVAVIQAQIDDMRTVQAIVKNVQEEVVEPDKKPKIVNL
jgi:hypothetical protein